MVQNEWNWLWPTTEWVVSLLCECDCTTDWLKVQAPLLGLSYLVSSDSSDQWSSADTSSTASAPAPQSPQPAKHFSINLG